MNKNNILDIIDYKNYSSYDEYNKTMHDYINATFQREQTIIIKMDDLCKTPEEIMYFLVWKAGFNTNDLVLEKDNQSYKLWYDNILVREYKYKDDKIFCFFEEIHLPVSNKLKEMLNDF